MRERALTDATGGHGVSGALFLDTCCEFDNFPCLSFADARHWCVELPKTPRQPGKSPSKGKKSDPIKQEPESFDYHEGLVHDIALKTHLQRTYELFKVRFFCYRRSC